MLVRRSLLLLFALSVASAQVNFQHTSYAGVAAIGNRLSAVDVNGDGLPDLVGLGYFGVRVMLNNGNGTFQSPKDVNWSGVPQNDLNGDGVADIAACTPHGSGDTPVGVSLATGPMQFSPAQYYPLPSGCSEVKVSDINGDGQPDLVATWVEQNPDGSWGSGVSVFFGDGTGNFSSPVTTGPFSFDPTVMCAVASVVIGDFNRDGKLDLVVPGNCYGSGLYPVLFLAGDGTGHFSVSKSFSSLEFVVSLRKDDIDQDGWLDVTSSSQANGANNSAFSALDFHLNTRAPGPPTWKDVSIATTQCESCDSSIYNPWIYDGLSADIDGDGTKDAVSLQFYVPDPQHPPGYNELFVQLGKPDGSYADPQRFMLPDTQQVPMTMLAADLDRDGKMDLAVEVYSSSDSTEIFLNRTATAPTCFADPSVRSVKVCSPAQLTGNSLHLLANTTDSDNVTGMKVYIDNTEKFYSPNQLINRVLTVPNGGHRITTTAWDGRGSFSSARWINVNTSFGCGAYSTNRSVHLCFPISNTTVGSPTQVVAAIRTSYAYHGAKIYVDGVSKYSTASKQVNANLNLAAGKHRITVQASDSQGTITKTIYGRVR